MKIKDYLLNQSSLAKAQFEKNHKLLNDLLAIYMLILNLIF